MANKMNKKGVSGFLIIFLLCISIIALVYFLGKETVKYEYVGKIVNMEGGTSWSTLILELDTIGKTPYRTQNKCSNKIRMGQKVYSRSSIFGKNEYLWVKYAEGKYC